MAWLVTSTDNAPEVWTLNKVALIRSVRPVPCWKCGYKTIQTGLFLELAGRDGYRCRIVSWSGVDKAGLLSQAFRRLLDVNWGVRPKYSKSMGCEYLAGVCPHCGAIQGDNFVYGNCQSRGGAFSDPEDRSQLAAFPLPSFVGDRPQSLDWAFGRFTTEEYQVRGFLAPDIPNHCRRMKSFSESSTGRISRAWHIRGTLPEG